MTDASRIEHEGQEWGESNVIRVGLVHNGQTSGIIIVSISQHCQKRQTFRKSTHPIVNGNAYQSLNRRGRKILATYLSFLNETVDSQLLPEVVTQPTPASNPTLVGLFRTRVNPVRESLMSNLSEDDYLRLITLFDHRFHTVGKYDRYFCHPCSKRRPTRM